MEKAGFKYRHASGMDMFLDEPGAKARDAVHVIFAGEKVRLAYIFHGLKHPLPGNVA